MALLTKSQFYYNIEISPDGLWIDFTEEGGPEIFSTAIPSKYTIETLADEIARSMNEVGTLTYSVSIDRSTRIMTISADGDFDILKQTGDHAGTGLYNLIGATSGSDYTGSDTYTFEAAIGSVYRPQFYLLDYVPLENIERAVESAVNVTGSGRVEVVKFGVVNYTEFTIDFINNYVFNDGSSLEYDPRGVENARDFLKEITKRGPIEFMPDRDDPSTYFKIQLESTGESSQGVGFRLTEKTSQGLVGYFSSGKLVFRKVD